MALKFKVYYKTDLSAPWIESNDVIANIDDDFEITVTGLQAGTKYYFAIVGGIEEDAVFTPYFTQAIGPNNQDVTNVDSAQVVTVQTSTLTS